MDSQKFWARLQSVGRASILSHFTKALLFCIKLGMQLIWNQNTTCLQVNHRTGHGVVFCCLVTAFLGLVGWFFRLAPSFSPSTSFPFVELLTHLATKFISWRSHKCFPGSLVEEAPSKTHTHFIHMLFSIDSILSNRSICGNWHQSLENPIWRRAFHYLICCNNFDFNTLHSNMI